MKKKSTILFILISCIVSIGYSQNNNQNYNDKNIYDQFAHRTDLTVAFIENFGLDNQTGINVTMITANNSKTWKKLKKEFTIDSLSLQQLNSIKAGREVLQLLVRDNINPRVPAPALENGYVDWTKSCYCIIAHLSKTIWIFHTHTANQIELVSKRFIYHTSHTAISSNQH